MAAGIDLDAEIRARLAGWAPVVAPEGYPRPLFTLAHEDNLSPEESAKWRAAWERMNGEPPSGKFHIMHSGLFWPGFEQMQGAIIAALDLHKPEWNGGRRICWHCVYPMGGDNVDWPCETVEEIAKALGIEVGGG